MKVDLYGKHQAKISMKVLDRLKECPDGIPHPFLTPLPSPLSAIALQMSLRPHKGKRRVIVQKRLEVIATSRPRFLGQLESPTPLVVAAPPESPSAPRHPLPR